MVINFVQKDIGEMFPKWEFDAEDTPAENIIKLMFVKRQWKWTMDCWEVTGTWVNTKPAVVSPAKKNVVKEDSPRPRRKLRRGTAEASEEALAEASEEVHTVAHSEVTTTIGGLTKEDIKTMFKDIVDAMREGFGTCLKEIKYLSERMEAVEKKHLRDAKGGLGMIASGLGDNSSIEGRKYSTPTRVSPARLVMELERFENYPWGESLKVLIDS
ncbi:hypothetical protein Bca52824_075239 [Brassica carinata]|uniref:Uncharacterized protein n=1 Tax=Brassica carinata TaxID=52824 RepID=A0A8X7TV85_BRACI|nr:hypothetical protein Bca52824_075239 [Brassica carinata]